MTNTSYKYAGNKLLYDAVVDADGYGDYTSIATALSTEGANKSVYVAPGTYTEASTCIVLAGQRIYFDDVTISVNGVDALGSGGDGSMLVGRLTLTGVGETTLRRMLVPTNNYLNWEGCEITLVPTGDGLTKGSSSWRLQGGGGALSTYNIVAKNISMSGNGAAMWVAGLEGSNRNKMTLTVDTLDNAQATDVRALYISGAYNYAKVIIDTVTTTGSNAGVGITITSNDNTCVGVAKNADGSNVTDTGARNNKTALNTA